MKYAYNRDAMGRRSTGVFLIDRPELKRMAGCRLLLQIPVKDKDSFSCKSQLYFTISVAGKNKRYELKILMLLKSECKKKGLASATFQ